MVLASREDADFDEFALSAIPYTLARMQFKQTKLLLKMQDIIINRGEELKFGGLHICNVSGSYFEM